MSSHRRFVSKFALTASAAFFTILLTACGSTGAGNVASSSSGGSTSTPLAITTTSVAGGMVQTVYSASVSATGGSTPYKWSVSSGSLPAGLALNTSSGAISGTPTAAGTSAFAITVADNGSATASKQFSIVVAPQLVISTSTLNGGNVSLAYSATLTATGGTAPYAWTVTSGSLPAGLSVSSSTGVISGIPA